MIKQPILTFVFVVICASNLFAQRFNQKTIKADKRKNDSTWFYTKIEELYPIAPLSTLGKQTMIRVHTNHYLLNIIKGTKVAAAVFINLPPSGNPISPSFVKKEVSHSQSKKLLKRLLATNVQNLPDGNKWGFGGYTFRFQIVKPDSSRFFSYWDISRADKNEEIVWDADSLIRKAFKIDEEKDKFDEQLLPGTHMVGRTLMSVDYILPKTAFRSSAYKKVEQILKRELGVNRKTDHFQFPLLKINGDENLLFQELNKYTADQVISVKTKRGKTAPKQYLVSDRAYFGEIDIVLENYKVK